MEQVLIGVAAVVGGAAVGGALVEVTWEMARRRFQGASQNGHSDRHSSDLDLSDRKHLQSPTA